MKITYQRIKQIIKDKGCTSKLDENNLSEELLKENTSINLICECGQSFIKKFSQIRDQKYVLCKNCVISRRANNRKLSQSIVFKNIKDVGYKILSSIYINNHSPIEVEDRNGYRGFLYYNHFKNRNDDIIKFSYKYNKKYFIYNLNNYTKIHNIKTSVLEINLNIPSSRISIKCKCECGEIYTTTHIAFLNGVVRCNKCANSISSYEYKIKCFLEEQQVKFYHLYRFQDCRDILPLAFDFYLPQYNLIIEMDGEGHYYPCHFNQIGYEHSIKSYQTIRKHDKIKDEYCMKHNINLLRIPYWEIKNSEDYKQKILNKIT